jgi:Arc/MetJ-type ribon-helix-helix transcriptional regulator
LNISLPEHLKQYVDEHVAARSCGTSSDHTRELILPDRVRETLRARLLEGAASEAGTPSPRRQTVVP